MAHVLLVGVPRRPTNMPRPIFIPNPIQKIPWSLIGDHEPILDYPNEPTNGQTDTVGYSCEHAIKKQKNFRDRCGWVKAQHGIDAE